MIFNKKSTCLMLTFSMIFQTRSAPQFPLVQRVVPQPHQAIGANEAPSPYDFSYKVDSPATSTYFGHNEASDPAGRVVGTYYVYLPDGRLMNVDYTVESDSGFVPRISFSNQRSPVAVVGAPTLLPIVPAVRG